MARPKTPHTKFSKPYVEIDPKPPSERQLEYAEKLRIKNIPPNASFYEVSNLINQAIKRNLVHGGRAAGLIVPDEISYEQGRDLEELLWCTDADKKEIWRHSSLPTDVEIRSARAMGVTDITEYTGAAMLFARAWEATGQWWRRFSCCLLAFGVASRLRKPPGPQVLQGVWAPLA